jgi:adenylate kinase
MRIILLGAPGSGKGTQAEKLMDDFGLPQISTGNLLRQAIADDTKIGKQAKEIMAAGNLVSDEIVLDLIRISLDSPSSQSGFVLDGYPRNIAQAESLDVLLTSINQPLDHAVLIDVDSDTLTKRLSGRRMCSLTGKILNIYFSDQSEIDECLSSGGELIQRSDDNIESITNRINVYREQTEPLLEYYKSIGLLIIADGNGEIDEVYKRVLKLTNMMD